MRHVQTNSRLPIIQVNYKSLLLDPFTLCFLARLVSGLVAGLAHLTVTIHASDIASKRMRRIITYTIVMIIATSTLYHLPLQELRYSLHLKIFGQLISYDINMIVLGLLVLVLVPLLTYETAPYYMMRGKVAKAQKKFAKLNDERNGEPSNETMLKLQLMVREDKKMGENIFGGGNFRPLFAVLCARLLRSFLMNASTITMLMSVTKMLHLPFKSIDYGYLFELHAMRIIIGSISLGLAACLGRHKFFYISALVMAAIVGGSALVNVFLWPEAIVAIFLVLSLGLDYYQQKQSIDVFTVTKKAWSLAMIAVVDHFIHAAMIISHISFYRETFIFAGVGVIVLSSILLMMGPRMQFSHSRGNHDNPQP